MSKVAELKADMVPAAVPTPPIPDNLGRKIPSLHCHIQPIMPLVFDDSMTFYECLAKCTAYVNAIGEQINDLTAGMKEFLEYMVKWGEELDAQWVQYQADLNKAWADYQAVINGQITDLENRWQAYQTNLNQQWQTFKTQYLDEWNNYKGDFEQEWQEFKEGIDSTISSTVNNWLTVNGPQILKDYVPGTWEPVYVDLRPAIINGSFDYVHDTLSVYKNDVLRLYFFVLNIDSKLLTYTGLYRFNLSDISFVYPDKEFYPLFLRAIPSENTSTGEFSLLDRSYVTMHTGDNPRINANLTHVYTPSIYRDCSVFILPYEYNKPMPDPT